MIENYPLAPQMQLDLPVYFQKEVMSLISKRRRKKKYPAVFSYVQMIKAKTSKCAAFQLVLN